MAVKNSILPYIIGCPKKTLLLSIILAVESLVRMGHLSHQNFFQNYRPINDPQTLISIFCRFQSVKTGQNMQKSIFGHKILQEHATTIQLTLLSYSFIALFRDTPLAHICRIWSNGHMAIYGQIWPNMAIWPYGHRTISKKKMGKWGIPGKIYKNVAQQC